MDSRELIAIDAEHGVLGAIMIRPELCEEVGAFLSPEDFGNEDNAALYALMLGAHSKKIHPDCVSLSEIRPVLPSGDPTIVYAGEIARNITSAANGKHFAKILLERAKARRLHNLGVKLIELAATRGDIAAQIAEAQQMAMGLNSEDDRPDTVQIWEAMVPVFDRMEEVRSGTFQVGLKFGLSDLDNIIKGLRPGNLAIIAGRPGTGKTVLGVGLAEYVSMRNGGASLIFSMEMQSSELAKRALASMSSVGQSSLDDGTACDDSESVLRMTAAIASAKRADFRICDRGGLTFSRLCSIARFEHRAKKLDVIVVDYLTLIQPDPGSKMQNRNQEIGQFTRGLKALAKELQIPIVVLAQLNRSIENRADAKPKMSDLRDSGEIEQDADMIIFAHRDNRSQHGEKGITEIDVAKCRHAQVGFCVLQFQGEFARFVMPDKGTIANYLQSKDQAQESRKSTRDFL